MASLVAGYYERRTRSGKIKRISKVPSYDELYIPRSRPSLREQKSNTSTSDHAKQSGGLLSEPTEERSQASDGTIRARDPVVHNGMEERENRGQDIDDLDANGLPVAVSVDTAQLEAALSGTHLHGRAREGQEGASQVSRTIFERITGSVAKASSHVQISSLLAFIDSHIPWRIGAGQDQNRRSGTHSSDPTTALLQYTQPNSALLDTQGNNGAGERGEGTSEVFGATLGRARNSIPQDARTSARTSTRPGFIELHIPKRYGPKRNKGQGSEISIPFNPPEVPDQQTYARATDSPPFDLPDQQRNESGTRRRAFSNE